MIYKTPIIGLMTIPYQHVKKTLRVGSHPHHLWQRKPGCPAPWWHGWTWKKLLGHAESQLQDSDSNGPFFKCYFCCREGTWLQMTRKSWLTVPAVTSMQSSKFFLGGSFNEMISLLKSGQTLHDFMISLRRLPNACAYKLFCTIGSLKKGYPVHFGRKACVKFLTWKFQI